jgi:glutathionylspermidine synthase
MQRLDCAPRAGWQQIVEKQGLWFHTLNNQPYWDESHYYLFEQHEIDELDRATYQLNELCLAAVERVIRDQLFDRFLIPPQYVDWVAQSWDEDEHSIYGRFDLAFDGTRPPALLEYNADTPTAVLEAAAIQWFWFQDFLADASNRFAGYDQFNSLHERLIEAWTVVKARVEGTVYFAALDEDESLEDYMTVNYLRDTAIQGGLSTEFISIRDIGWNTPRQSFVDPGEAPIRTMFKLYPWEWMLREEFGRHLPAAAVQWFEPPWKMLLSNKALLPTLYEMFPRNPYLLPSAFEPLGDTYVKKPIFSREGANVSIVHKGKTLLETEGRYGAGPFVYQEFRPLPRFDLNCPVIGSWIVNGYACGIGIREDDTLITGNLSRFVPHLFRRSR